MHVEGIDADSGQLELAKAVKQALEKEFGARDLREAGRGAWASDSQGRHRSRHQGPPKGSGVGLGASGEGGGDRGGGRGERRAQGAPEGWPSQPASKVLVGKILKGCRAIDSCGPSSLSLQIRLVDPATGRAEWVDSLLLLGAHVGMQVPLDTVAVEAAKAAIVRAEQRYPRR